MPIRVHFIIEDEPDTAEEVELGLQAALDIIGEEGKISRYDDVDDALKEIVSLLSYTNVNQPGLGFVILDIRLLSDEGKNRNLKCGDELLSGLLRTGYPLDPSRKVLICTQFPDYYGRQYRKLDQQDRMKWSPIGGYYRYQFQKTYYKIPVLEKDLQIAKHLQEALIALINDPFCPEGSDAQ